MPTALGLCLLLQVQPYARAEAAATAGSIELRLDHDRLTLEVRGETLAEVIAELGDVAGFEVVLVDGFADSRRLDLDFRDVPLERALERLLRGTDHILFHAADRRRIAQLWLLRPYAGGTRHAGGADTADGNGRGTAVLRLANRAGIVAAEAGDLERIRTTLTRILAADPLPLVRIRAAMALGRIGDDGAVDALAAATGDPHASVSAQAITALGRIDSPRSTAALGEILLDTGRARVSRILAAQALWRHSGANAREYLAIGAADADPQVRRTCATAPTGRVNTGRRGPVEAE